MQYYRVPDFIPIKPVLIGEFKTKFRAWLYKYIHYDWGADPAWQGSFRWEIEEISV